MSSGPSLISKLKGLIEEGGNEKKIEAYEEVIVEEIEEYVKKELFYILPTNEIMKIIGKSEIGDVDALCEFISRMNANKGEESTLLLNVIKREDATLEECVKILSKFEHSPLCQRTNELFSEEKNLPERDFEHELVELKKETGKHEKETKETKETKEEETFFPPVTVKPSNFESYIFTAATDGKLTSVQYHVEQLHADVERKGLFGNTVIILAAKEGHLDVVKYLYEKCHANVEAKNNYGFTPLNYASGSGYFEVVKYLCEKCHAKVTEEAIKRAKTEEIREYLISKR